MYENATINITDNGAYAPTPDGRVTFLRKKKKTVRSPKSFFCPENRNIILPPSPHHDALFLLDVVTGVEKNNVGTLFIEIIAMFYGQSEIIVRTCAYRRVRGLTTPTVYHNTRLAMLWSVAVTFRLFFFFDSLHFTRKRR